jgi:NAD(P)-dependent dehydrogenase (short-subunit alcohol dehydrogenase family)
LAEFPLKGGVAVITGAASGIGAALASNLAGRGTHLALADRNPEGLRLAAGVARDKGVTVSEHVLDVADGPWQGNNAGEQCWRGPGRHLRSGDHG